MNHTFRPLTLWSICCACVAAGQFALGAADISIQKTDAPDPVRVGQTLTYFVGVSNRGPDAATGVMVTDVLPDTMQFISCQVSQGSFSRDGNTVYANLGTLNAGATALVTIAVRPTLEGIYTNQASVTVSNGTGGRASAVTSVRSANRSPVINVESAYYFPIGVTTGFTVTASDPDHDPVITLTNPVRPSGASFDGVTFTWAAPRTAWNTTNWAEFVADDNQGEPNSVVTSRVALVVPYDGDADSLPDSWEWDFFGTLARDGNADSDGDGQSDRAEYIAGTNPTNAVSVFKVDALWTSAVPTNRFIQIPTVPGRKYEILWRDSLVQGGWQPFASTNAGVWWENASAPTNRVFRDDEGPSTTGGPPPDGRRFYKVRVSLN